MNRRNGFTLVELIVVVLILGILAGVAAPKMFKTTSNATENGLRQSLAVIRDAIELHYAEKGSYPTCTDSADFHGDLKDYLRGPFPSSPVGDDSVTAGTGNPLVADGLSGWLYNASTGEFICNDASYADY